MTRLTIACLLILPLAACATHREARVNRGVRVAVSHYDAGMAVIEAFADRKIPLADDEGDGPVLPGRGSNARFTTIVSDTLRLEAGTERVAECRTLVGVPDAPDAAVYRVGFLGSEQSTTVVVSVGFSRLDPNTGTRESCKSLRVLEQRLESYIKLRAERSR